MVAQEGQAAAATGARTSAALAQQGRETTAVIQKLTTQVQPLVVVVAQAALAAMGETIMLEVMLA
jgi:pyruvate/2-oxoacid:ferredoxin oxidoreductase alpha subunit